MWFFVAIKLYHISGRNSSLFSISRGYLELFLVGKVRCFNNTKTQINQYGETKLADLYNTPREKELYSFRFEERCLTNQLPYDDFYKFVFKNKDGSSKQKDKICAFQNHFFRLSDGIPVLTKKEYIYKLNWNNKNGRYYAKDCIPELVVDYAGSHLHDTYKQITVFLRKYQIRTFEEAFETEN